MNVVFALVVVFAGLLVHGYKGGDIIYSVKFNSTNSLQGYNSAPWATLVNGGYQGSKALNITVPVPTSGRPETRMITTTPFNVTLLQGSTLSITVVLKAINVSKPLDTWNGIKVMLYLKGKSGSESWTNDYAYGTFDWTTNTYTYFDTVYNDAIISSLYVGLQDSSGTVLFDSINIVVFRPAPTPLPTPPVNPPPAYNGHPNVTRFRGVMSPQTYVDSDMQILGVTWKANLMRWQLTWTTATYDERNNLTLYDQWLQKKLNETDKLLAACVRYGIKVVVDLHTVPGARDSSYGDLFLIEAKYQQHFLEVWESIAQRYKGNEAVWGYDIANEPLQSRPGYPGVLAWPQLAEATTQLIRKIDRNITIIIESEIGGGPQGFSILRPVNDSKVVYSVHFYEPSAYTFQGVVASIPLNSSVYPGVVNGVYTNITTLQNYLQNVRDFQLAFNVQIYVGEFSAARWAANATAVNWLRDCITIFENYGWDWTYHAYREWQGWSVEYDESYYHNSPVANTTRKTLLLNQFNNNVYPYPPYHRI